MTPNDLPGDPGPIRRPRRDDPTPEQRSLLDSFARTQPDPKAEARALHEMHEAGLTDAAIHDELTYTYQKHAPSPEVIRERRCLWRVLGDLWPDAPVTYLRLSVRYARQALGLDGVHEIEGEQAEQVRDRALPLIAEAAEKKWTSRWLAHVIDGRTKPVHERAGRARRDDGAENDGPGDVLTDGASAGGDPGHKEEGDEEEEDDEEEDKSGDEEKDRPPLDETEPVIPPPEDFSLMLELARQLTGTDVPAEAKARRAVFLTVVDVAVRILDAVDSDRERGALIACLRDRLPLDELANDNPDPDAGGRDDDDDDMEFPS